MASPLSKNVAEPLSLDFWVALDPCLLIPCCSFHLHHLQDSVFFPSSGVGPKTFFVSHQVWPVQHELTLLIFLPRLISKTYRMHHLFHRCRLDLEGVSSLYL